MKNYFFLLSIIFILFSCNKKKDVSELITNGNYKYWLQINDGQEMGKGKTLFYFDKRGRWLVYKKTGKGWLKGTGVDDICYVEYWDMFNDSTINMGSRKYHIETINNSTFIYIDKKHDYRINLITAPDSLIPWRYRKLQN